MIQPGISVLICCYNSAARLPETLRYLSLQNTPVPIEWEVIVVDNASTDGTAKIAAETWQLFYNLNIGFTILHEPKPGKNHAFEKGIKAARYEYLLTCDDDNRLNDNYIARAFELMQADTEIGVLGGCGIFNPEEPARPEIEKYKSSYVNGPQTWAVSQHWVYGAGAIFRKNLLAQLVSNKWQLITSGRIGNSLNGGEDAELCFVYYLSGYKIIADYELLFNHFVPIKRQNYKYIINLSYWQSYSNVLLYPYYAIINNDESPVLKTVNQWCRSIIIKLIKQLIIMLIRHVKTFSRLSIDEKISLSQTFGTLTALLKNRKKLIQHYHYVKTLIAGIKLYE